MWVVEWDGGGETNPLVTIFWEMNRHNKANFKSSSFTRLHKQFRILSRCKRNKANGEKKKANKDSGYNTRDISLPYDLMWVSAG